MQILYNNFEPEVVLVLRFISVQCKCTQVVASVNLCKLQFHSCLLCCGIQSNRTFTFGVEH